MQAKVTTAFQGRPDGEVLARPVRVGEVIGGDLAAVAVGEGWAVPIEDAVHHSDPATGHDGQTNDAAAAAAVAKPGGKPKSRRD